MKVVMWKFRNAPNRSEPRFRQRCLSSASLGPKLSVTAKNPRNLQRSSAGLFPAVRTE